MSPQPEDLFPNGSFFEVSVAMHELYTGLRAAGFSLIEACTIVGTFMANSGAAGQKDEGSG